jgi:hypothetical protein
MSLASGDRLGSHTIVAPLGRGGMGDVYLAEDAVLKRRHRAAARRRTLQ